MVYTELHLHTAYSFLDGASQPEEMVIRAANLGYTALAVTDHDGVYGALEFAKSARAMGIQPITGAEITLDDGSHLTLLAETRAGYGNLCRLITESSQGTPPAGVDMGSSLPVGMTCHLADYASGMILLTGCRDSQLSRLVDAGRGEDAELVLRTYIAWFGAANVFVELQHNAVLGDTRRVRQLVALAERVGVGYVATGNVHYHRQDRHRLQDVLVSIRHRTTLDGSHRERRANAEFHLRSPAEMAERFARYPEAIRATEIIAARCAAFDLTSDLGYSYPDYQTATGETSDEYLARTCWEIFAARYPSTSPRVARAHAQLNDELRLIAKHRLAGFFLLYRDLLIMAREVAAEIRGYELSGSRAFLPPGRGRGSAVSSIVCYLIGLSPVDPLTHDLYVGRFLNEELRSIPDIDIDFPREIREKMILRMYEVYGHNHVAMVCAFATYRLKSAVRDVGKTLGIPVHNLDRIAKLAEPHSADSLATELQRFPEYASRMHEPPWSHLVQIATQLAGFPRHITQHSGGVIVSSTPLNEIVPIQPAAMEGRFIAQWDKDSIEDARMIKIDFLALGMLSLVEECLALIDVHREPIDLSRVDYDDPRVYQMIQAGDTIGTFQIESRAQIQMVRRTKPASLADLVIQVAIVRPGPIVGGAVTPFVKRRTDPNYTPAYDHPLLEPVLRETLGVVLYQEQVIQVAEAIAGFSAGQADELRRSMTRKRSLEAMQKMRDQFMAGAAGRGIPAELAAEMFRKLEGFASYGFPKSHSAAFALLAYQSCWLKHYYPAEFLAALLNNQPMGFYQPHVLINDARRSGIRVLRPDLNRSAYVCTVEGPRTIRVGLSYVKGVSEETIEAIVLERETNGPYLSLTGLVRRIHLRRETVESLIAAGALDGYGLQRREMLWQVGLFVPSRGLTAGRRRTKTSGHQLALALPTAQDQIELPRMTTWERMADAYRTTGFSLMAHPIGLLRHQLPQGLVSSRHLGTLPDRMPVAIPGLVVCRQRPGTAKGMTFLLMEDEHGLVNVIVYPDLYERERYAVRSAPYVIVEGRLQLDNNNVNIIATDIHVIDQIGETRRDWERGDDRRTEADPRVLAFPARHDRPLQLDEEPVDFPTPVPATMPPARSFF